MKFTCPKCNTRYSIGDEKVPAATTLRFPCRKCGTVIRLRRKGPTPGAQSAAPAPTPAPASFDGGSTRVANLNEINRLRHEASGDFTPEHETTRVSSRAEINKLVEAQRQLGAAAGAVTAAPSAPPRAAPDAEEWYVLIAGKQKGPLAASTLVEMLAHNEVDKRSYIWKDGMAEWQRLGTVPEFKDQAERAGPAAWRVMQPTCDPVAAPGPNPFESGENTVAMNARQLQSALAKSKSAVDSAPPSAAEPEPTTDPGNDRVPAVSEPTATGAPPEAQTPPPEAQTPELLSALTGIPTGERLTRPMPGRNPARAAGLQPSASPRTADDLPDAFPTSAPAADHDDAAMPSEFPAATEEPVGGALGGGDGFGRATTGSGDDRTPYFSDPQSEVNQAYVNAPPGESTRVFMATAGLYRRRRTHRVAAAVGILVSVTLVGVVSLDIVGTIQIPGMGMLYDVTGLVDPNKDRAVKRVEERLSDEGLDPSKRGELEQMRRKLLGQVSHGAKPRASGGQAQHAGAGTETVAAGEGVKEAGAMDEEQRKLATSVFADTNKRETQVNLAEPTEVAAVNLPSGLTQETIFKVITDNSRSMNLCLTESMRKGEKLSGKMEIFLTIAPDGSVPEVKIEAPEFRSTQMAGCAVRRIKSWKFPRFNGEPVTVSYPYLLQMGF
ncbi:MAG: zinc-ribbon domain-containing protein [Deltaproteobacteria bacterium]|nr:zinc-ribbon domain-containing protein [Deltaproteobacteria bacterium]